MYNMNGMGPLMNMMGPNYGQHFGQGAQVPQQVPPQGGLPGGFAGHPGGLPPQYMGRTLGMPPTGSMPPGPQGPPQTLPQRSPYLSRMWAAMGGPFPGGPQGAPGSTPPQAQPPVTQRPNREARLEEIFNYIMNMRNQQYNARAAGQTPSPMNYMNPPPPAPGTPSMAIDPRRFQGWGGM